MSAAVAGESGAERESGAVAMVTATIDGKEVRVPKGTNIIEAAKSVDIEVPFYCYHPHLSVPGNCRICQVEVVGAPKLMIGCHTQVTDGMVVKTHNTSDSVKETQASTMELLLINHPLDCTVCDQAGHCKLQDYHYEYNARPSRFLENKEHKPKAVPLGPTVMLDAERCIACTRCVRFCDEVTETGEIGLLNRGDRYTIAVKEGHELNNPLSGTVVDLCPVGALTHRNWRFNTRIWYANPTDSVCPGCSTGCNVKVFERDGQVVQVKARLNAQVNKEWLCDEGRYGFHRFLPQSRVLSAYSQGQAGVLESVKLEEGLALAKELKKGSLLIMCAPDLTLEDYLTVKSLKEKCFPEATVATAYRGRGLSKLEQILVSPDYAPNFRGSSFVFGTGYANPDGGRSIFEQEYTLAVSRMKGNQYDSILFVGDRALADQELASPELLQAIHKTPLVIGMLTDMEGALFANCRVVLPARSVLEKGGMFLNRSNRLQYLQPVVPLLDGTLTHWKLLSLIGEQFGKAITEATSDRELTLHYLQADSRLAGVSIRSMKQGGVELKG